jgi:hypothetical protein
MIEFKNLQEALAQYAQAIADKYKTNLESSGRRATGQLITSVNTVVVVNENEFAIDLNLEDYWKYVEEGRGAGKFPPPDKILEWIRVKPILPTPLANGKLPTEQQLAFLIGRKIANEGFQGTHDLQHTMEEVDYEEQIQEAMDKDVLGCLDELLAILK